VFIEAKNDGGGGDNWTTGTISRAKLQSNHHHQHPVFLQAGCPSCRPTNSVKAMKGNIQKVVAFKCVCNSSLHLGCDITLPRNMLITYAHCIPSWMRRNYTGFNINRLRSASVLLAESVNT